MADLGIADVNQEGQLQDIERMVWNIEAVDTPVKTLLGGGQEGHPDGPGVAVRKLPA